MASIQDIRVNSVSSSDTVSVYVPGDVSVLTWEYVGDVANPSQAKIDIKIGNSSTDWGMDNFGGEVLNVSEDFTGASWDIPPQNLTRGQTYYGQIKGTDSEGDATAWSKFIIKVNMLPFVTGYSLSPTSPGVNDNIDLSYTFNDPDGHDQSGTKIRWFKNNLPIPKYDGLCTLPSSATSAGDSWTAKVIPSDGIEFGPISETSSIVIQSGDSGFDFVRILPTDGNVDDILKVEYEVSSSEYVLISGTVVIEWFVNNVAIANSNSEFIRLDLTPGDVVTVTVSIEELGSTIASATSDPLTISDVPWYVFDLEVSGKFDTSDIITLDPILEWQIHKTTATSTEKPSYLRVLITKTESLDGPIFDTGVIEYTKNSYTIPDGNISRGQRYFFHVGVGDVNPIPTSQFVTKEVQISGSSWENNVSNDTGWTVEFNVAVEAGATVGDDDPEPNMGIYIHDGTYFCSVLLSLTKITFLSGATVTYDISSGPNLQVAKTFKIAGKGQNVKIFMDNRLIIDAVGAFSNPSQLKRIEFGDIDGKNVNFGTFRFIRYSTSGAYGLDTNLDNENTFYFSSLGKLEGGSIQDVLGDLISWLPDDATESSKIIKFNINSTDLRLSTVTKNFSPITKILVDDKRNKFIGTANGVTGIYGEKHDPDFFFDTSDEDVQIIPQQFDVISNVSTSKRTNVEPDTKKNWFTIDTTYRAVGVADLTDITTVEDEYNPYLYGITSHAIHYYSQRTHGHTWYDLVDNEKGWQVQFQFDLDLLEADDFQETNLEKQGFGVYVNDGTYQEIIYFYEDRIRLFYANVFVPINNTVERRFAIVGKGTNLKIYQTLSQSGTGGYQLLMDASGMFTTPSGKTGNSRKPKIVMDSTGIYHAVWHDDSNGLSQIFYSSYDGSVWSTPEIVSGTKEFTAINPSIDVDGSNRVWVAYEDTSWGNNEIAVSVKDNGGWNPKVRLTNFKSNKGKPDIKVDTFNDVHVVWEDNRNGHWEIFWAVWTDATQSWTSSGQFGVDTAVSQFDPSDPYQTVMDFKNPKISLLHPNMWMVCEGVFKDSNPTAESSIYLSFLNTETGLWSSSGTPFLNSSGEVVAFGSSELVSSLNRRCVNPQIATSDARSSIVIVWEDQTEPISQIWGASFSPFGNPITLATQVTSQGSDCKNPDVGFIYNHAVIVYEKDGSILSSHYNALYQEFVGSATGSSDTIIEINSSKNASHPSIPSQTTAKNFAMVYDYKLDRDVSNLSTVEAPEFQLIGDAIVEHSETTTSGPISTTETLREGIVSEIDTKEFAFGDFSSNVGMLAHWRDIKMYFGYDAIPQSISKFNTNTLFDWPDDRINDLFVDAYGNIIAATFGGLVYHNVFTGKSTNILGTDEEGQNSLLENKLTTTVKWGKNGVWYVGTTQGLFYTKTAGRFWAKLNSTQLESKVIVAMTVNKKGECICSTKSSNLFDPATDGLYVCHPDQEEARFVRTNKEIRAVEIDENNIIWAGGDSGLLRIENESFSSIISFDKNSGMRSSHVNDIAIVNKHLRYIATAAGVEKMNGMKFFNINTQTHSLLNNNISSIEYYAPTNSLWVGSLYSLHEIVFRDPVHDIILDEITQYDNIEISTNQSYDSDTYYVLDFETIDLPENTTLSTESATVFINRNPVEFGYTVDEVGQSILFSTDLLIDDQVEIEISNRFLEFHDFNQSAIEKQVKGDLRRSIEKLDRTDKGQLLLLSGEDKPGILLFNEQQIASLPFTTIMLDRDPPFGCLEKLTTLSRTILRFSILAFDRLSGLDGYILSNYENFTSDGETPLDFSPPASIVDHNIGEGINNVVDSLSFPTTVTIDSVVYPVGDGTALGIWTDTSTQTSYLYAGTSSPAVIFKYDPTVDTWTGIRAINSLDSDRQIHEMKTFFNILYLVTGTDISGGVGAIYKSVDGTQFDLVGSVTGSHARGLAASADGTMYFGSSDGKIYQLKNDIFSVKYQNIGQAIYSLDIYDNILVVGTGNQGRVFTINLETDDNLIIFDAPDSAVNSVHIRDANIATSADEALLYIGGSDTTTIYRSDLESFDFTKSYSSFNKDINRIRTVDSSVLREPDDDGGTNAPVTTTIACIGDSMFQNAIPAWEFFYRHSETINDFIQFFSNGVDGVWLISNSKVTKWTSVLTTKTVYLRLRDKAGNISDQPILSPACPTESTDVCCNYAYTVNISDLKNFVNESRIVDITEYGEILFTYDAPNNSPFFSADQIDEEVGVYTSEVFNGSNDLVSWKTITWESTEPTGTSVNVQIRSGITEDDLLDSDWSLNLVMGSNDLVSIEHITNQYLQFRVILRSQVRDISPTLTSVTLRSLTSQASHFFTTNFVMPSRPVKGLLTSNSFIPVSADIVFGINTNNSVDFGDYQIIEPNRLFTTTQGQFGSNLRIGAKLLSPGIPELNPSNNPGDPYDASSFVCSIPFTYTNSETTEVYYDFRIRFYNDPFRTQLIHTFFTGNDQTGWSINTVDNVFPAGGLSFGSGSSKVVTFTPGTLVSQSQRWYVTIDAWNGSFFETISDSQSYICATCNIVNEPGLIAEYYSTGISSISNIPDFGALTPDRIIIEDKINFALTSGSWVTTDGEDLGSNFIDSFAIRFRGRIQAPVEGTYTFSLTSDDGSALYIDGEQLIDMDGLQATTTSTATVDLTSGFHDIEVHYFEGGGGAEVSLKWIVPGDITAVVVPSNRLYHAITSEYCEDLDTPRILNFAVLFELENGETIKVNLGE